MKVVSHDSVLILWYSLYDFVIMLEVEFFSHPLQQRSRNCTYTELFVCTMDG